MIASPSMEVKTLVSYNNLCKETSIEFQENQFVQGQKTKKNQIRNLGTWQKETCLKNQIRKMIQQK